MRARSARRSRRSSRTVARAIDSETRGGGNWPGSPGARLPPRSMKPGSSQGTPGTPMADRGLHIGVDARETTGHPTGAGRYLLNLLRACAAEHPSHRWTLFTPGAPSDGLASLGPAFEIVAVKTRSAGTWWEQTQLPAAAARAHLDVFLGPA